MCIPPIVARLRLYKNVTAATNTYATAEELLDASFSMQFVSYQRTVGDEFSYFNIECRRKVCIYLFLRYDFDICLRDLNYRPKQASVILAPTSILCSL
jgi:hypothetical protein